jgi:hypothetical protein
VFSDKNVASAVSVSLVPDSNGLLVNTSGGTPVYGYQVDGPALMGAIKPRPVTLASVTVDDKVYDGSSAATVTNWSLTNLISDDQVQVASGTALFDNANVGTNKSVLATPSSLGGSAAGNYSIGSASATGSASISPRALAVSGVSVADKVYDGGTSATVTSWTLSNLVAGDSVQATGTALFSTAGVGTAKPVEATATGLTGAAAGNYSIDSDFERFTGSAAITPRPLTMSNVVVADKVYDGSNTASISGWTLSGLVPNEQVNTGAVSGVFSSPGVGNGKPVQTSFSLLPGLDGANYMAASPAGSGTASITPRPLALASVTVADKVYDGGVAATVTQWTLSNVVPGDQVQVAAGTGQFSSAGVGSDKPVLATASSLGGASAANYSLGSAAIESGQASITPAPLRYLADPTSVVIGQPWPAFTGTVTGFVADETLLTATTGSLAFTTAATTLSPPGRYAVDGSGLAAANYSFAQAPANTTALLLIPSELAALPANPYVTRTAVLNVLPPAEPTSPTSGRAIDALVAVRPGNGEATSFANLDLDKLSPAAVASVLAARDEYKQSLFKSALDQLEQDPTQADAPGCATAQQAATGQCLVTAPLAGSRVLSDARVIDRATGAVPPRPTAAPPSAPAAAPAAATPPAAATAATRVAAAPRPPRPPQPIVDLPARRGVKTASLPQIQRKIALLIGIDRYSDARVPQLGNAVNDVRAVAAALETHLGYETVVLENANRSGIFRALNQLVGEVGPADSVLLYYAGHGELVEKTGLGYWQPSDADPSRPDTWISNTDIDRLMARLPASQVAMISDSCFSGSLASGERIRGTAGNQDPATLLRRRAAVVMTSGGNEPVSDAGKNGHSPFAWNLMQSLDRVSSWKSGSSVFEQVRFAVARQLPQRPQYAAAANAGHEAGADFVFEQRQLDGVVK